MLPGVKIIFSNGNLGGVAPSDRNLLGFIISAAALPSTFALNTAYQLKKYSDLVALGIDDTNNPAIDKAIKEFYREAPEGTTVWIYGVADTVKPSDMLDPLGTVIKGFVNQTKGSLRGVVTVFNPSAGYTPSIVDGVDSDVFAAITNAQLAYEWATTTKYAPFFVILEGYAFNGTPSALADLSLRDDNAVGVVIGDTVVSSPSAAIGVVAGRIATTPPHRKISRVASGPLSAPDIYIGAASLDSADVETIHDKGYITFRNHVGRAGNFITHDPLCAPASDDYGKLTARRVINEAYRELYQAGLEFVDENIPVNADGTIDNGWASYAEKRIEQHIVNTLGAEGIISSTNEDSGVVISISRTANIVSLSSLPIVARVRPFGYATYIEFDLGYQLEIN